MLVDVAVDTTTGVTLRKRCVAQPTKLQATLLHHLRCPLPDHLAVTVMQADVVEKRDEKINELIGNDTQSTS